VNFLLDTNVVSETRRKRPDAKVLSWYRRADPASLYISVLTLGEIAKGVVQYSNRDKAQSEALHRWLNTTRDLYADRIVPIDAEIAEAWGKIAAPRPRPVIDGLLAATAIVRNMTLVTRNVGDLADSGAAIVDPWES
jgi:predicted nucleic acid-binding protein